MISIFNVEFFGTFHKKHTGQVKREVWLARFNNIDSDRNGAWIVILKLLASHICPVCGLDPAVTRIVHQNKLFLDEKLIFVRGLITPYKKIFQFFSDPFSTPHLKMMLHL